MNSAKAGGRMTQPEQVFVALVSALMLPAVARGGDAVEVAVNYAEALLAELKKRGIELPP